MLSAFSFKKIEIIDDEESDMISNSEVDQMSSLLDYKVSAFHFLLKQKNHYPLNQRWGNSGPFMTWQTSTPRIPARS